MFWQKKAQAVSMRVGLQIKIVIVTTRPYTGVETGPQSSAIDDFWVSRRRGDGLLKELSKVRQQTLVSPLTKKGLFGRIERDACYSRWS
jgi:hypothetical protein